MLSRMWKRIFDRYRLLIMKLVFKNFKNHRGIFGRFGLVKKESQTININSIKKAKEVISKAFLNDPDFKLSYTNNIAMLLYGRDYLRRPNEDKNEVAEAIVDLIFGG